MTPDVLSLGTHSATASRGRRVGSWREWSALYERSIDRPAPTVDTKAARAWRIHPPGQRASAIADGTAGRLSIADLSTLQGFPADYPWQGNNMDRARQVGDAVPPPFAAAILGRAIHRRARVDDPEVIDLCAGPGGWEEGLRQLDPALHARTLGIEWDAAACQTRAAAGHHTLQADIATVDPTQFKATGLIASPPCTLFSLAGTGVGRDVLDLLAHAIMRMLNGDDCRVEIRATIYPTCLLAQHERNEKRRDSGKKPWTVEQVIERAHRDAYIASLVLEPARYLHGMRDSLRWCTFEQVPAVAPLWSLYAIALRPRGWSCWTGLLNSADFGVPQTRIRAIFIGRKDGPALPPEPTHTEGGSDGDLFGDGLPDWVSMADALGWGATDRPMPTVTAGGTATGGAEPIARGGRAALARSKRGGAWL